MLQYPYNVTVSGKYGAPMGRPSQGDATEDYIKLACKAVPMVDGDYDKGGAYWGGGSGRGRVYCVFNGDRSIVRYYRATSYLFAQEEAREEFPQADFL